MRHLSGQALGLLHRLLHWLEILLILLALGLGAASWRLSRGPWEVPGLAGRIAAALAAALPAQRRLAVHIGSAALAWEGFRRTGAPVDIRLTGLTITDRAGLMVASLPQTRVSLGLGRLLLGEIAPESVIIVGPRFAVRRAASGAVTFAVTGAAAQVAPARRRATPLAALAQLIGRLTMVHPAAEGTLRLRELRHVAITGARVTVVDRRLGAVWNVPAATVELSRTTGRLSGVAALGLALPHGTARVFATLAFTPAGGEIGLSLDPTSPADLATTAAALAPLRALAAPVSLRLALALSPALRPTHLRASARIGAGALHLGGGVVALRSGAVVLSGGGRRFAIERADLALAGPPGLVAPAFRASGTLTLGKTDRLTAAIRAGPVAFATLGRFWPADLLHDPRTWVVHNITAGTAAGGHLELALALDPGSSHPRLVALTGGITGTHLAVRWLPRLPPLTGGRATLVMNGVDGFTVTVAAGHQGRLALGAGTVVVSGLTAPAQLARVTATVSGGLAPALALLGAPGLDLRQRAPIPLRDPAGRVAATISATVPLFARLTIAEVGIAARARLSGVHLGGVLAGRDLDQGRLTLAADNAGLQISGTGALGGVPVRLDAAMDFRRPPGGVLARLSLSAQTDAAALEKAGLPISGLVRGPVGLTARLTQRKGGGDIAIVADFSAARLALGALAWVKPPGVPARGSARLVFAAGRAQSIDSIRLTGSGLALAGRATLTPAGGVRLRLSRLVLGRTAASGTLDLPGGAAAPIRAAFSGPLLDLAPRLAAHPRQPHPAHPSAPGPPWQLAARFARVILGKPMKSGAGRELDQLDLTAASNGAWLTRLALAATPPGGAPVRVSLAAGPGGRVLAASTNDAGALFRAADLIDTVIGGKLTLSARYEDAKPAHPLTGTLEITGFRVRRAPLLGRLLQAMTLYGLADVMGGPGLAFRQLIAPFSETGGVLSLHRARAFSPSLGLTAQGTIDPAAGRLAIEGTIVPAYFFNALLGHIPLVGRIFSPEKGSGLFAATYTLRGRLADPTVSVNPLSALTPGFLRGVFGLLDPAPQAKGPAPQAKYPAPQAKGPAPQAK